jgi:cardiolipin synthase C
MTKLSSPFIHSSCSYLKFTTICAVLFFVGCKKETKPIVNFYDHCAAIVDKDTSTIESYLKGVLPSSGVQSGAYVLEDGDGSMIARAWLTQHASKSIDIQYFIFSVDNVGLIACDYLVRAADRGVKVRILVDDMMVDADEGDLMVMDAHPNIDIKIYNPGANLGKNLYAKVSKVVTDFRGINQRMHNKIFLADDQAVITGGRNIADEYFDYDHEYNFRDRDIFLIGAVCSAIKKSFEQFWNHPLSTPVVKIFPVTAAVKYDLSLYDKLHQYACDTANYWTQIRTRVANIPLAFQSLVKNNEITITDRITYVSDDPGKNDGSHGLEGSGKSTEALITLVKSAKKSIDIQSPYLITTAETRALFAAAIKRGVKVRILTNSLASTDNLEAFSGYQRDRKNLLEIGIKIYEFRPDAECKLRLMTGALRDRPEYTPIFGLHAKSMTIDGNITVVGTFNLDPRSIHLNTECLTIIHNQKLTQQVQVGFDDEFGPENAWEPTLEWNPDSKVNIKKRTGSFIRRLVPKSILSVWMLW